MAAREIYVYILNYAKTNSNNFYSNKQMNDV